MNTILDEQIDANMDEMANNYGATRNKLINAGYEDIYLTTTTDDNGIEVMVEVWRRGGECCITGCSNVCAADVKAAMNKVKLLMQDIGVIEK